MFQQYISIDQFQEDVERNESQKLDFVARNAEVTFDMDNGSVLAQTPHGDLRLQHKAWTDVNSQASIPAAYAERLKREQPELLVHNLNERFQHDGKDLHLWRGFSQDSVARAVLSPSYKMIDNHDVVEVVMNLVMEMGQEYEVRSFGLTEANLYLKIIFPHTQQAVAVGDLVQHGVVFRNSEVGKGALAVQPFIERLICTNGMISPASFRRRHVGAKHTEVGEVSAQTKLLESATFLSELRDSVLLSISKEEVEKQVELMRAAKGEEVTDAMSFVTGLQKTNLIAASEVVRMQDHLIKGGDTSKWGLINAVTRTAEDAANYERATELEALGGTLLSAPKSRWSEIFKAGKKKD